MIGREFHGVRFAIFLLHVDEELGGRGGFHVGYDGDELVVWPLVRHFHGVGIVRGNGVSPHGEDSLVLAFERVPVFRAEETGDVAVFPRDAGRRRHLERERVLSLLSLSLVNLGCKPRMSERTFQALYRLRRPRTRAVVLRHGGRYYFGESVPISTE